MAEQKDPKGKVRSPAFVIILAIITCGIYYLIWIYNVAKELKLFLNKEDLNPGLDLLLCIVCPPFAIYWVYKYGQLIDEALEKVKLKPEDNATLYLVLAIFGFIVVDMAIMQSSLNKVWSA
ncbi:MAG: DUF4234 domain-containing protein [Spirochaetes bacterium]|nr:DUF4234 domain-containing protein [Spirochaetota bacterium]